MQATTQRTQFPSGWLKSGIAALALTGALAIGGIAINVARHDGSSAASVSVARTTAATDAAQRRFVEINTLPLPAAGPAATNERFLEMNLQPESTLRTVAPNYRFVEMNILPGDDVVPSAAASENHLREVNLLPGDDTGDVAPWSVTRGLPY